MLKGNTFSVAAYVLELVDTSYQIRRDLRIFLRHCHANKKAVFHVFVFTHLHPTMNTE